MVLLAKFRYDMSEEFKKDDVKLDYILGGLFVLAIFLFTVFVYIF